MGEDGLAPAVGVVSGEEDAVLVVGGEHQEEGVAPVVVVLAVVEGVPQEDVAEEDVALVAGVGISARSGGVVVVRVCLICHFAVASLATPWMQLS